LSAGVLGETALPEFLGAKVRAWGDVPYRVEKLRGGGKSADGGEGAVTLIEVEAVADNEFILNDKADPASSDGADPFSFFAEENADLDGAGAELFGVGAGAIEGEA